MKKQFVLLVLLSIAYTGFGQNIYPIAYDDCTASEFFLEGKTINTEYNNEKLLHDLISTIDEKILRKTKGSIYFQVVVDTLGSHCCVSMQNELNAKVKKIDFKNIMDTKTEWSIPIRDGKKAPVSAMVKIEFEKKRIIIKRLGLNMKTGWIELSKYVKQR